MMRHFSYLGVFALVLSIVLVPAAALRANTLSTSKPANNNDISVQARGPIHEAFAQPLDRAVNGGLVVSKGPPRPIPEEPPEVAPEGDNVQWIPGYWAWDDDRRDFSWVSGTMRVPPVGRKWVPGYWAKTEDGWQWINGFWARGDQPLVEYQEAPPDSLETGPTTPAPGPNSLYVPGTWVARSGRFAWRPGFWGAPRRGLVYIAPTYVFTPSGWIFVDGYWDYCLENRGLLFAPICFNRPLWLDPDWSYRPSYCISLPGLLASLFVRPGCGQYYYGDYYGQGYRRLGFAPWYSYGARYGDPLLNYYRWSNRGDRSWYPGLRSNYLARTNGRMTLPPRTLDRQNSLIRDINRGTVRNVDVNSMRMVQSLASVRSDRSLTRVQSTQLATLRTTGRNYRGASTTRQRLETSGRSLIGSTRGLSLGGGPTIKSRSTSRIARSDPASSVRGNPNKPSTVRRPSYQPYGKSTTTYGRKSPNPTKPRTYSTSPKTRSYSPSPKLKTHSGLTKPRSYSSSSSPKSYSGRTTKTHISGSYPAAPKLKSYSGSTSRRSYSPSKSPKSYSNSATTKSFSPAPKTRSYSAPKSHSYAAPKIRSYSSSKPGGYSSKPTYSGSRSSGSSYRSRGTGYASSGGGKAKTK